MHTSYKRIIYFIKILRAMPTNKTTFNSYENIYTKKYKDNDIHNSVVIIHSNNMM